MNRISQTYLSREVPCDKKDYSEINKYYIRCIQSLESIMDLDAFILDYPNKKILYRTRVCSLFNPEIKESSFNEYKKIIFEDDILMLNTFDDEFVKFFYRLPPERRLNGYLTFDFNIKNKHGESRLVNYKQSTLDLTEDGHIRLSLCIVSSSIHSKSGNIYIKMNDTAQVYEFMHSSGKFIEIKDKKLSQRENDILGLISTGKTNTQIASELGISVNTVKYHKKQIFGKLGVKSTAKAIQWKNNQKTT